MSQSTKWTIGAILVVLVIIGVVYAEGGDSNQPTKNSNKTEVNMAGLLPLSGEGAAYGESMRKGMQLAASQEGINLSFADTSGNPKDGVSAYRKLQTQGVDVLLGPVFSTVGQAVGPIAQKNGVISIATAVSSQEVTGIGDNIFSLYPTSGAEGQELAEYAVANFEADSYGIISSQEEVHIGVADAIAGTLKTKEASVAFRQALSPDTVDFRAVITSLKRSSVDAVFVIGKKDFAANMISQSRELNLSADFYSYAEMFDESLLQQYGGDLNGLTITAPYFDAGSEQSKIADFRASFKQQFGKEPDVWAAYGYDAVKTVMQAREKCQNCTVSELADTMESLNLRGVTGPFEFNKNGHAKRSFRIFRVQDGEFVQVGTSE